MLGRIVKRDRVIEMPSTFREVPVMSNEVPITRVPIKIGTGAACFSASVRNCAASVRKALPLNAQDWWPTEP